MISPPAKCPSCDSDLEWSNDNLYCRNDECEAKTHKQVEHFAKTLKIKGLGPSTIEKLELQRIEDIYDLTLEVCIELLKSEKLATKLCEEINQSLKQPANVVLPAFGIPLIGKSAADKLSAVVESVFDITSEICDKAGLGPKATSNLMEWIDTRFERFCDIPFSWEFERARIQQAREVICISGKLNSFKTKAEASEVLVEKGFLVKDSLTKDVTILVSESDRETDKTRKARESGVKIVNNLKEYLENLNDCPKMD